MHKIFFKFFEESIPQWELAVSRFKSSANAGARIILFTTYCELNAYEIYDFKEINKV